MGSELLRRGLSIGACPALWNIEKPDDVREVHESYVNAGCDALVTNTFGANRLRLEEHGLSNRAAELNARAVDLARAAAGSSQWVLGSVGPCSGFGTPQEGLPRDAMLQAYSEQVKALSEAGVDALLIETCTDSAELRAAVEATRSTCPATALIVSLCFKKGNGGTGYHLIKSEEPLEVACELLAKLDVDAAGVNCGIDVHADDYTTIAAALRACIAGPILVRPNGGRAAACGLAVQCADPPEMLADAVWGFVRAGASIIGGCCGTTPEHIRLFRAELDRL